MSSVPAPGDPGRDEDPAWLDRDPMTAEEREAWLDRLCGQDDDPRDDPQEYWDPESCAPPPGEDELTGAELAGIGAAAADEMLALDAASTGRRGPGQAGSGRVFPGESASRAAGFGAGMAWDVMPGCAQLAVAADAAEGEGPAGRFGGVADHELIGLACGWDRVEAHAAARKLVALAEVFRRNPEDGFEPEPGQMPAVVHEFTRDQLALALGESRAAADWLLTLAWHLGTRLAGTLDALRDGIISRVKAEIIIRATAVLEPAAAAAAEAKVLDRAGRLTPGGLRSAIARAVIEVAPETARQRRQTAARFARVERWAEDSGNAALMGRELPPDEVLAADQRICWWAGELRKAGLDGGIARRARRARPGRPVAGPRPGRRGRAEPQDDLVRDRDRPGRPRCRARLRPARIHEPRQTRWPRTAAGRGRVLLHPGRPGYPGRRIRYVAAAHSRTRTRPDRDH